MLSIGVRELRQHASRYLNRVKSGESIEVTDRGHLVAMLVPPSEEQSIRNQLIAEGALIPASGDLLDIEPLPLPPGAIPPSEILARMREDERY